MLLGGIQAIALPRTTILLLLFLTAFIWIAVILMLLLAVRYEIIIKWKIKIALQIQFSPNLEARPPIEFVRCRLRCIEWDISRSFLLRLGLTIFSIVLIFTMAQVNAFTCHVDAACAIDKACSPTFAKDAAVGDNGAAKPVDVVGGGLPQGASCHRWCPLPQYAVLSCLIGFMTVAIFLRVRRILYILELEILLD